MDTLGILELRSIALGAALSDSMLKSADIELIKAGTICPGKYIIYVAGDRMSVQTAISQAKAQVEKLVGSIVISNISPQIFKALSKKVFLEKKTEEEEIFALGLVESATISACIKAADSAIKKADVTLARLALGQGIAGKAYFVLYGDLSSVETAVQEARTELGKKLIEAVVIARPENSVIKNLMGG